jgi:hypothetical protein
MILFMGDSNLVQLVHIDQIMKHSQIPSSD